MPQRKPRGVPPEPEGRPELLFPTSQVDQEVQDRITRGQELLEEIAALAAELQSNPAMPDIPTRHRALLDELYTWDEYNEQLLRSRFTTAKVANGYKLSLLGRTKPTTMIKSWPV